MGFCGDCACVALFLCGCLVVTGRFCVRAGKDVTDVTVLCWDLGDEVAVVCSGGDVSYAMKVYGCWPMDARCYKSIAQERHHVDDADDDVTQGRFHSAGHGHVKQHRLHRYV